MVGGGDEGRGRGRGWWLGEAEAEVGLCDGESVMGCGMGSDEGCRRRDTDGFGV